MFFHLHVYIYVPLKVCILLLWSTPSRIFNFCMLDMLLDDYQAWNKGLKFCWGCCSRTVKGLLETTPRWHMTIYRGCFLLRENILFHRQRRLIIDKHLINGNHRMSGGYTMTKCSIMFNYMKKTPNQTRPRKRISWKVAFVMYSLPTYFWCIDKNTALFVHILFMRKKTTSSTWNALFLA